MAATSHTSTSREVGWRDAVTPLSRASRRRWTACYALLLIFGALAMATDILAAGKTVPLILVVALPIVFGMLRRGTRRIAALDHADLDLPTGVLAWREPDPLDDELPGEGFAEPVRDALLGAALALGVVASVIVVSQLWALPFAAVVALLGGLARRQKGQPMMSRQRKWRIGIGLALLALLAALALVSSTGSNEEGGIVDGGGSSVERTK